LEEYTFRFNRGNAAKRGLLFYRLLENAMRVELLTYRKLVQSWPLTRSFIQVDTQLTILTANLQENLTAKANKAQKVFTGKFVFYRQFVCFASV
jgi:hypothetical protein